MEPIQALKMRIDDYISSHTDYLASGVCKSMEEYASISGKIRALSTILMDISEIEKRYIEN